jgi:hypothetical protein
VAVGHTLPPSPQATPTSTSQRPYTHGTAPPDRPPPALSEDIDITILSLASQAFQIATLPLAVTKDDPMAERTSKRAEMHLDAVAREKRRRHPSDRPFKPSVLSLGGRMEAEARDALKLWKSAMMGGVYRKLSLGLLRARDRCFEL